MNDIYTQNRWVVWNLEEVNGRNTKVPYSVNGKKASSTDPSTWTTYEKAKAASEFFSGIGVIFTPEKTLLGIDIDHVLEDGKIIGDERARITRLIKDASTYTEISPSGTGLHLYLGIESALSLEGNRRAPYEAYTSGRFFTFTENSYHARPKPIRSVSKEEALSLLQSIGYPWKNEPITAPTVIGAKNVFTDEELTSRMFASRNGAKILALWDGDTSEYEGDESRADAALLHHLAFWSQKDSEQMERLWLSSPLGSREKTAKRKDYRTRSITNAIETCKEVYTAPNAGIDFLFSLTAKGDKVFSKNTENVYRAIQQHPKLANTVRFDAFKNRIEVKHNEKWNALIDSDVIYIQTHLSILFQFLRTVGKDMVFDALVKVAKDNTIDSGADFIRTLVWDQTPRLDQWLTNTYGTSDDTYHRAVASNWLKGLVKRIIQPGCKFDYVLVLEGEQGVKKSTSLGVLGAIPSGDNWHVESTMSTDNKDFFMQFEGKAIIEFSEGETLSRTEVKKMKSIITTAVDRYRPSYGRVSEDFPRRCVFAMTTNQDEYLKDETGNRRWLPVRVVLPEANVQWLADNRDQLLAEAYTRVITNHETTYEFPREETLAQQSARRISDPNEDRVIEWYYNDPHLTDTMRDEGITVQQVYTFALSGLGQMRRYDEQNIAGILREKLKLTRVRRSIGGTQQWRWINENVSLFTALEEDLAKDVWNEK
jgi:predicted P-loop ATPase